MFSRLDASSLRKITGLIIVFGAWQTFAVLNGNHLIPQLQHIVIKFIELV